MYIGYWTVNNNNNNNNNNNFYITVILFIIYHFTHLFPIHAIYSLDYNREPCFGLFPRLHMTLDTFAYL